MVITMDDICKNLYASYGALLRAGFTDGHALGIISNTMCQLIMQNVLRDEAEVKRMLETPTKPLQTEVLK